MAINILGGHARGHALFVPPESITRPTSVMLRRKFFDAHQDLTNCLFVDLFAGSGAMGFEALSRGAKKVVLVDDHPKVLNVLKKNKAQISKKVDTVELSIIKQKAQAYLKTSLSYLESASVEFDESYIFIDPPYELKDVYLECLKLLKESSFSGEVWIESDRQKGILEADLKKHSLTFSKVYKQGTSYIARIAL
ncbi:RsmD family RNA methyltransferase [Halobacteriovorax sp. CON-3]|uniref:RsmD family RNA methyltransferase n=1 Tax=Halobacteriovorax sp. CON-3 TaxID=3157710 RepID=UPI0037147F83